MRRVAAVFIFLLSAGGIYFYLRGDPLRSELDKLFPPISVDQQRQTAVNSTSEALRNLPLSNIAAGIDLATIQSVAMDRVKGRGVEKLDVSTERQLLRITAAFDVTLHADDLPADSDKHALVAKLIPRVTGTVDLYLGATASISDGSERTLQVRLLPVLSSVHVNKIDVAGDYDATAAGAVIAALLNRYADNLTSAIDGLPLLKATLPASLQNSFDPSGPIQLNVPKEYKLTVAVSGRPIKSPFVPAAVAILIDEGEITAIAQLASTDRKPADHVAVSGGFEAMKASFWKSLREGIGIDAPPAGVWIGFGKALLAEGLDSAFAQAEPCLIGSGTVPREEFRNKVRIPDETSIECTPKDDCTPSRDCTPTDDCSPTGDCTQTEECAPTQDCSQSEDCSQHEECRRCGPFGICINDPVCEAGKVARKGACEAGKTAKKGACEAAKTAQKTACEGAKEARRLDCERLKTQRKDACELGKTAKKDACELEKSGEKAACEAGKSTKKGLCETAKEGLKRISRTGSLANLLFQIEGTGDLKLCFHDVRFATNMDAFKLTLDTSGMASLDTHVHFIPLDIVGHALCPADWTADKRITTTIPQQPVPIDVALTPKTDGGEISYTGTLAQIPIRIHFEPSPLALVLQNPNFYVSCLPTAGLLDVLTLNLAPFIPDVMKDFEYTFKAVPFSFAPHLPAQVVEGYKVELKLVDTSRAILLKGAI